MIKPLFYSIIFLSLLALAAACAPSLTPTPALTPPSSTASPSPPTAAKAPVLTAEEAAWQKIIDAAKKEGKVTIYSYNFVGDIGVAMERGFENRYGIQTDILTGRGAEFFERLKTEKRMGNLVGDLTEGSAVHIQNMKNEGLTVGIAADLPVLREKDVWLADILAMDPVDNHALACSFLTFTPYVNTKFVKAGEEPKQWKDLLLPRWKGQMVLTDPLTSGGPQQLFVTLMREKVIDEDYLKALYKQDLRFSSSIIDEGRLISTGERTLSIRGQDNIYSRFAAEGAPIKAVPMDDGTIISANTTTAFAKAPHPNAAKVFINWFLSAEGQDTYAKASVNSAIRKDVKNYLTPAVQITAKRPMVQTNADLQLATKLFTDRWLDKLWGR